MGDGKRSGPVTLEEQMCLGPPIDQRRYREALHLLDGYLEREQSYNSYYLRGSLRLRTGDLEGARQDFLQYRYPKTSVFRPEVRWVGVVLWLQGKPEEACEDWANEIARRRAKEISHTDPAGGVLLPALLWWASAHPGLERWRKLAVEELRRRWRTKWCQASRWPGPLAPFLLGQRSAEALLAYVEAEFPPDWVDTRCQAHFYVGARALDAGDEAGYRRELALAAPRDGLALANEEEYYLARFELDPEELPWLHWAVDG
jgi:hypothetical protein